MSGGSGESKIINWGERQNISKEEKGGGAPDGKTQTKLLLVRKKERREVIHKREGMEMF